MQLNGATSIAVTAHEMDDAIRIPDRNTIQADKGFPLDPPGEELTKTDVSNLVGSGLTEDLVTRARLRRVSHHDGKRMFGVRRQGDYGGILFPYYRPGTAAVRMFRLRRDKPDVVQDQNGVSKIERKYLSPPGAENLLYFVPDADPSALGDTSLPVAITEGEKKTLSLQRLSEEAGMPMLPIGLSGVWNWKSRSGPIEDLNLLNWYGRKACIVFDANVETNQSVERARADLTAELQKRGADVRWVNVPEGNGVNGIDDYIGIHGCSAAGELFEKAQAVNASVRAIDLKACVFDPTRVYTGAPQFYDGLIGPGDLGVWIGREKHRKSTLVLAYAMCAALGRPFLTFRFSYGRPLRVVILDYESTETDFQKRYEAMATGMGLTLSERAELAANLKVIFLRTYMKGGEPVPTFPVWNGRLDSKVARNHEWWKDLRDKYPAEQYIIDPMRCMHDKDENDSKIVGLLASLRSMFGDAAVIIPHHMKKQDRAHGVLLKNNMRAWSEDGRGSSAIKAHCDVIVCQERLLENDEESIWWGCFLKSGPDVGPLCLKESDHESFHYVLQQTIPGELQSSFNVLKSLAPGTKANAVQALKREGKTKSTAYRHVEKLLGCGALQWDGLNLVVTPATPGNGEKVRQAA